MAALRLIRGGKIDGASTCNQHALTPHHDPIERGDAAMATSDSTPRLCIVCDSHMPARKPGRPGPAPECCSESCKAKRHAEWYEANRARITKERRLKWNQDASEINAARRAHWAMHREAIAAKRRHDRTVNVEAMRAQQRDHYARNKDRIRKQPSRARVTADKTRARDRYLKWKAAHPGGASENSKRWIAANLERYQASRRSRCQVRRARKAGAFVERVDPRVVYAMAKGVCGICWTPVQPSEKWHIDHIVPLAKGGAHSYDNVQLAHAKCNLVKHAKLPSGQGSLFQRVG